MHLYQGTTQQFIADATQARLANQLSDRFFDEFRYRPAPSETRSCFIDAATRRHFLRRTVAESVRLACISLVGGQG